TAQHTDKYDVSMAHVLAAAVLILGPAALLKFNSEILSNPEVTDAVKQALKEVLTPGAEGTATRSIFSKILDPFGFFK
ncbi:unnamed protein product, partial [marine sediment metagenome]